MNPLTNWQYKVNNYQLILFFKFDKLMIQRDHKIIGGKMIRPNIIDPNLASVVSLRTKIEDMAASYKAKDQTPEDLNPAPGQVTISIDGTDHDEEVQLIMDQQRALKTFKMARENQTAKTKEIAYLETNQDGSVDLTLMHEDAKGGVAEIGKMNMKEAPGYMYMKKDYDTTD
jgi:hypothetical protein